MADPLVATVTHAVTRGFLDFTKMPDTEVGWLGVKLRLEAAGNDMVSEVLRLDAFRAIVSEPHGGKEGTSIAVKAIEAVDARIRPWTKKGSRGTSDLDLIVQWYMLNAPEALRAAGVPLG